MTSALIIRPLHFDDLPVCQQISDDAFYEVDVAAFRQGWPAPARRTPSRQAAWIARSTNYLTTDPQGAWCAELDGEIVGFAISYRRDVTWLLATYAVRPGLQGKGIGKAILDAALTHAKHCLRGMLAASDDPGAAQRYQSAGFDLHPQMCLRGRVDRALLPVVDHMREGTPGDFALMDSIDRQRRDAAHGGDHVILSALFRLIVTDTTTGSGYVYVDETGSAVLLAASNERTATRLLWESLAASTPDQDVLIGHITGANQWALKVGVEARLSLGTAGYLGLRGMKPPTPYLHHGSLL